MICVSYEKDQNLDSEENCTGNRNNDSSEVNSCNKNNKKF